MTLILSMDFPPPASNDKQHQGNGKCMNHKAILLFQLLCQVPLGVWVLQAKQGAVQASQAALCQGEGEGVHASQHPGTSQEQSYDFHCCQGQWGKFLWCEQHEGGCCCMWLVVGGTMRPCLLHVTMDKSARRSLVLVFCSWVPTKAGCPQHSSWRESRKTESYLIGGSSTWSAAPCGVTSDQHQEVWHDSQG